MSKTIKVDFGSKAGVQEFIDFMVSENKALERVYDAFKIGANARNPETLMVSLNNTLRFAENLHAIENEFFMVAGEPSNEPEDLGSEPEQVCLLNWGASKEEYVLQFAAALDHHVRNNPLIKTLIERIAADTATIERLGNEVKALKNPSWAYCGDCGNMLNEHGYCGKCHDVG